MEIGQIINTYLNNPRCIILAVLPAGVDYHNSKILAAAKKVDPEGTRTVPVITKPDTIDAGAEGTVLNLLLGKYVMSKLGFHMTKCRGQKQLNEGVTLKDSLALESEFFSSTEPWCSQEDQRMFGVANLKEQLAELQVKIVESSMPGVLSEISSIKSKALADLESMGEEIESTETRRVLYDRAKELLCFSVGQVYDGIEKEAAIKAALSDKDGYNWCTIMQHKIVKFGKTIQKMKINNITAELHVGLEVKVEEANEDEDIYGKILFFSKDEKSVMVVPHDKTETRCYVKLTSDKMAIGNSQGYKAGEDLSLTALLENGELDEDAVEDGALLAALKHSIKFLSGRGGSRAYKVQGESKKGELARVMIHQFQTEKQKTKRLNQVIPFIGKLYQRAMSAPTWTEEMMTSRLTL